MTAAMLLEREEFYYANCIVIGGLEPVGYVIEGGRLRVAGDIATDWDGLTGICETFSAQLGGSLYGGGEAFAHGSCGYFFKRSNGVLNWVVMSLDAGPFIGVVPCAGGVRFLASGGSRWTIIGDDVAGSCVEALHSGA